MAALKANPEKSLDLLEEFRFSSCSVSSLTNSLTVSPFEKLACSRVASKRFGK
jgi:hypothetical protein